MKNQVLCDESAITPLKERIPLGTASGVWRTYVPLCQAVILTDEKCYYTLHSQRYKNVRFGALENILAERTKRISSRIRSVSRNRIRGGRFLGTSVVLLPTTDCHLRCRYCYAAAGSSPKSSPRRMDISIAEAGIRMVCRNAALHRAAISRPVTAKIVFHGGGEPTLDWRLFTTIVERAFACAREYSVPLQLSLTTNGIFSEDRARWIGDRFDSVHVSVDGPPEIQDAQRPFLGGTGSSGVVFRAMKVLCSSRAKTTVRSTVTSLGVGRGKEIVTYLFGRFPELRSIHFEPAVRTLVGRNSFASLEPADFVEFLKEAAQAVDIGMEGRVMSTMMMTWVRAFFCSGSQGRECNITPSGEVTSCSEVIDYKHPRWHEFRLGRVNVEEQKLKLDSGFVQKSIMESGIPNSSRPTCIGCIARWHCRGGCRAQYLTHLSDWSDIWCSIVQPLTKWLVERLVERAERDNRVLDNGSYGEDGRDEGVFGAVAIPDVPDRDPTSYCTPISSV